MDENHPTGLEISTGFGFLTKSIPLSNSNGALACCFLSGVVRDGEFDYVVIAPKQFLCITPTDLVGALVEGEIGISVPLDRISYTGGGENVIEESVGVCRCFSGMC